MAKLLLSGRHAVDLTLDGLWVAACRDCPWTDDYNTIADAIEYAKGHADDANIPAKSRKFMVSYAYSTMHGGTGNGRIFLTTTAGSLTQKVVEDWERLAKSENGFAALVITNILELEG